DDVVFAPGFGSIRRVWACLLAPSQGTDRAAIDGGARPVDSIVGLKLGEQRLVQSLPDSRGLPVPKAPPAGHAAAAAKFLGQVFPRDAGLEHKQDSRESLAVVDRFSSRKAESPRLQRRQQRFDTLPKSVRK